MLLRLHCILIVFPNHSLQYATQGCYAVGASGAISCIISNAELLSYEGRSRQPYIFGEGDNYRNYASGIIIATLSLTAATLLYLIYFFSKLPISIGRDIFAVLFLAMFIVAGSNIFQAFSIEAPYYRAARLFPFWDWVIGPVKKNSGVAKRLIRIISYALTECNSVEELSSKTKVVLINYLNRTYFPTYFRGE